MPYEINIADPDTGFEATFVPEVGMIGSSLRHEGEEMLFQGAGLEAYKSQGSTFALPLLHPWANRVRAWDFELGEQHVTLDPESPITHRDSATGTAIHGLLTASPHWTSPMPTATRSPPSSTSGACPSTWPPSRCRTSCATPPASRARR